MSSLVASLMWSLLLLKALLAACHWAAAAFSKTLKSTDSSCTTMAWTRLFTRSMPYSIIRHLQGIAYPPAARSMLQVRPVLAPAGHENLLQQQAYVERIPGCHQ